MKVICISPSLLPGRAQNALTHLGFKVYDSGALLSRHILTHPKIFTTLMLETSGSNEATDFEMILGTRYNSVAGFPGALVWKNLIAQYPHALILVEPVALDLQDVLLEKIVKNLARTEKVASPVIELSQVFKEFSQQRAQVLENFDAFREEIYKHVPSERIVELNQKWEPLCHALNVPVPNAAFPSDNSKQYHETVKMLEAFHFKMKVIYFCGIGMYITGVMLFIIIFHSTLTTIGVIERSS